MQRNWLKQRRMGALLVVATVVAVGLNSIHVNTYRILPGDASPLAPIIKVTGVSTAPHPHATREGFMMVDVTLSQMTALGRIIADFRGATDTIDLAALVPKGSTFADFDRQSYLDMEGSKTAAELNAFRTLGWPVPATPRGALITDTVQGGPAKSAGIQVADRIVSINGTATPDRCTATTLLHSLRSGTVVHIGVEHARISGSGVISYRPVSVATVKTVKLPKDVGISDCPGISTLAKSWIGVAMQDAVSYAFPATVTIDTNYIGGPSAGLAMTLALIDQLSSGSLSGHRKIAVTGEMSLGGLVGDIGGITQKTQAAITAGASVFIVPANQVREAQQAAHGQLRVIGAYRLAQVLSRLRQLGGDRPIPYTKPNF